jgi:hypothetical protein
MNNPWKLATLALAAIGVTALSTGVTTAYLLRPPAPSAATLAAQPVADVPPARMVPAPAMTRRVTPRPVAARPAAPRVVRASTVEPVADDCGSGGQRAMKIAKPGLVGALAGAGLGAVGGAIADGGNAAGKGALIGGLAGAVLGGGYGAYKTRQECGTIFGDTGGAPQAATPALAPRPAWGATDRIAVYDAR